MREVYVIHPAANKGDAVIYTREDLLNNAREQAAQGIKPSYGWIDEKNGGIIGKPGFLVYSTWKDGAGVAVLREDGTGYIMTGWQADFSFVL